MLIDVYGPYSFVVSVSMHATLQSIAVKQAGSLVQWFAETGNVAASHVRR